MEETKRLLKRPPELIRLCKLMEQIKEASYELDSVWGLPLPPEAKQADRLLWKAHDDLHDLAKRISEEDDLDPDSVLFWAYAREIGASPPLEGATA